MSESPSDGLYEQFLTYFARDQHHLFAYVRSLVPNHADAQDVFQRCSLTLWKNFAVFDQDRPFLSWACRIAFNEVRNYLRTSARDRLQFDDHLLDQLAQQRIADLEHRDARLSALHQCIEGLPTGDRELVRIAYDDTATIAEFAKTSGKSLQSLYNRLSAVRRRLLQCVEHRLSLDEYSI